MPRGMWGGVPSQALVMSAGFRSPPDLLGESLWGRGLGDTSFHRPQLFSITGESESHGGVDGSLAFELDRPE